MADLSVTFLCGYTNCKPNIMWKGKYPGRGGIFPHNHPCAAGSHVYRGDNMQFGDGPGLQAFRALGYWVSCFPEGDGLCLDVPEGKTPEMVVADIKQAFGWTAKIKTPGAP